MNLRLVRQGRLMIALGGCPFRTEPYPAGSLCGKCIYRGSTSDDTLYAGWLQQLTESRMYPCERKLLTLLEKGEYDYGKDEIE
jgi:hypothetical protein